MQNQRLYTYKHIGESPFIPKFLQRWRNRNKNLLDYCQAINESLYAEGKIRSWKKYRMMYGKLERFLSDYGDGRIHDIPLKKVSRAFIMEFDAYLRSTSLHPNSVSVNMAVLQTIINRAFYIDDAIPGKTTPFHGYTFRQLKSYKAVLSPEEIASLRALTLKAHTGLWDARNAFLFSYYCAGIRVGDLLRLKWSNVCPGNRLVYVMSKNLKYRDLVLVKPAIDILSAYGGRNDGFIFPYLNPSADYSLYPEKELMPWQKLELANDISNATKRINRALEKICGMAGIGKHVTMHVSRHSFASLAREKGVMSAEIKNLLAHSNLKTTEIYMGDFDRQKSDDILHNLFE